MILVQLQAGICWAISGLLYEYAVRAFRQLVKLEVILSS